ncbi:7097_t:CDS:1, partial [Cetraspora pellucida]
ELTKQIVKSESRSMNTENITKLKLDDLEPYLLVEDLKKYY